MELEFDVKVTRKDLFDYQLHSYYTSFSGLVASVGGAILILLFSQTMEPLYLIIGLFVLLFFPWNLFLSTAKAAVSDTWKDPFHYRMTDEGIEISRGEETVSVSWENVLKAVSTSKSILVYTSKKAAFILPKAALGEKLPLLIQTISTHVAPSKVKIRGN